jgi:hypothetical protein
VAGQSASHGIGSLAVLQHQVIAGMENSHHEVTATQTQEEARAQKAGKAVASEPQVLEAFKNEKVRKAKVDEG